MELHFAVIGDPIAHSWSPLLHERAFTAAGVEARYERFRVKPGDLGDAVRGLRALGFAGWNVTIPHKETIIPWLDELTPEASRAGAVNTVKVTGDRLIGHNTDGSGFVAASNDLVPDLAGRLAVIVGAGGAAKGIAVALAAHGMRIHIVNRSLDKAEVLADLVCRQGGVATSGPLLAGAWLAELDLLVQTTSIGLHGEQFPFSLQGIRSQAAVVDIIYRPWETPFLREAKSMGCRTMNGLAMFLHQGALAWQFWLDRPAPRPAMWQALLEQVHGAAE